MRSTWLSLSAVGRRSDGTPLVYVKLKNLDNKLSSVSMQKLVLHVCDMVAPPPFLHLILRSHPVDTNINLPAPALHARNSAPPLTGALASVRAVGRGTVPGAAVHDRSR